MANVITDTEISQGLEILRSWLIELSIMTEWINIYYDNAINCQGVSKLSMLFLVLTRTLCGQLSRCLWDQSRGKPVSVLNLYYVIRKNPKFENFPAQFKNSYVDKKTYVESIKTDQELLKTYAVKHFAHREIMSTEEKERQLNDFRMTWNRIKNLLSQAKDITNVMFECWENKKADFEENKYFIFRDDFTNALNPSFLTESKYP